MNRQLRIGLFISTAMAFIGWLSVPVDWSGQIHSKDRPDFGDIKPNREGLVVSYPWDTLGASRSYFAMAKCQPHEAEVFVKRNQLMAVPRQFVGFADGDCGWFQEEIDKRKAGTPVPRVGGVSTHSSPKIYASYYGDTLFVYTFRPRGY